VIFVLDGEFIFVAETPKGFENFFKGFFGSAISFWSERITVRANRHALGVDTPHSGTITYITQYEVWHACNTL
jgi:hypothetical protein